MKSDYHEINDDHNRVILQTLMDNSDDEEVRKVISSFTIENTGAEIVKKMMQLTLPPLKKAAQYLDIPEPVSKSKLKATIISNIVNRLNALLREFCTICGEYYHEDLDDKPLARCILCNQGCHNPCQEPITTHLSLLEPKQVLCRPFMCASCIGDHSEEDPNTESTHALKSKKSPNKQTQKPIDENEIPQTPSSPRSINGLIVQGGDPEHPLDEKTTPDRPKKEEATVPVCPEYKWGRCPKYEECQFRHPPRCWTWLEKGKCSYKKKCRYHHPPLCYTSLWERQCYKQDCKFFHLQKTKRFKMEEEQLKTSLNVGNFNSQFPSLQPQDNETYRPNMNPQTNNVSKQPQHHLQQNQNTPKNSGTPTNNSQTHQQPQNRQIPHTNQSPRVPPTFSKEDMSFLVITIKEILKQEIGEMKQNINTGVQQSQTQNQHQITPQIQSLPLLQISPQPTNPTLYNLQVAPRPHSSQ